jgi:hypothetical protein
VKRLALALGVVALAVPGGAAAAEKTIATATVDDLRVTLAAKKGRDAGGAPSASVELRVYRRGPQGWRFLDRRLVGPPNGFFWFPLTGAGAVRDFCVKTKPDRVSFQVLVTPSIGWSPVYRYRVAGRRLVRG